MAEQLTAGAQLLPGQTPALPCTPQLLLGIGATATAAAAAVVIGRCLLLGIKAAGCLAQQWFISCSRSCSMCMWHSQLVVPVCCCLLQEPPAAAGTWPVLPAITAGFGRHFIGVVPTPMQCAPVCSQRCYSCLQLPCLCVELPGWLRGQQQLQLQLQRLHGVCCI